MKWTEAPSNHLFPARFDSILKGSMELITFGFVETRTIFTMGERAFRGPVNGEIKVAWNDIGQNSRYSCRDINEISSTIFLFSHPVTSGRIFVTRQWIRLKWQKRHFQYKLNTWIRTPLEKSRSWCRSDESSFLWFLKREMNSYRNCF